MSPLCKICSHKDREAIDEAIVRKESSRAIVRQFAAVMDDGKPEFSKDGVLRHAEHVSRALARVVAQREEAGAVSALDRLEDLYLRGRRILDAAESEGKASLSLQAMKELRSIVDSIARITGELDDRPQVNVLNVATAPQWVAVRAALMEALAPFPDARDAVAGRLAALPELEVGR